jgi:hypothetical protein
MAKRIEELDPNFKDQKPKIEEGLQWISADDKRFTVNGLAWFKENGGEFLRLPKRVKGVVRDPVWDLSTMPSGGRVRFKTDSANLKLRIQHSRAEIAMTHMCAVGVSGIDLYEGPPHKMVYWASNKTIEPKVPYVCSYLDDFPRKMREFALYLPTYNDLVLLEIGLDSDAKVRPPSPFRLEKPIVFYGTSITQGGCSSRGANGYVPLVGRMLGVDVINLGFSGNGQSDPEIAPLLAEIDAACYVNDCVANMSVEGMKKRYASFNEAIRIKRPTTPILLMTTIRWAAENYMPRLHSDESNTIVRETFNQFRKRGANQVHLLDCRKIIGYEADHPSVDGVHLTDLGYKRMADGVALALRKILELKR